MVRIGSERVPAQAWLLLSDTSAGGALPARCMVLPGHSRTHDLRVPRAHEALSGHDHSIGASHRRAACVCQWRAPGWQHLPPGEPAYLFHSNAPILVSVHMFFLGLQTHLGVSES